MPAEAALAHRNVRDTNLPYVSNQSPTVTEPCYVKGSLDLLTNINGYVQRRPGFSDSVEPTPTIFNNLVRIFQWDDFQGNFFVMFNDINASGFSQVFKMQVGLDASAVSIYTDTSANPFDFVMSNGIVYFGNGVVMKKWNATIGLENWGIGIGSVNNEIGPNVAGNGANGLGTGPPWTSPNNVTSPTNFAITNLVGTTTNSSANFSSANLNATQFGLVVPASETINGILVSFDAEYVLNSGTLPNFITISGQLLKNGSPIGNTRGTNNVTTVPVNFSIGSVTDLWNTTWVPNDINQTTFGIAFAVTMGLFPHRTSNISVSIRNVNISIWGIGGPIATVSASAGTFSATVGYEYVFCYGNSMTGHISSPTPASPSTGIFTNKLNVSLPLTASTDPQVNQIRVFRSTDSAAVGTIAGTFFEIPTSPYTNTNQVITDNATDTQLNINSIAPTPTFNDPPPPSVGFVYFSGRIWMFVGNLVWFTGLEEIFNGVPEECVPSGLAGNFWRFDEAVTGLGVAGKGGQQTLLIFCGGRVYGITGNSLDTFQRFLISNRRGTRNRVTIAMLGGMCAWLDTASQIWATDGSNLSELSVPIRPDIVGLTPSSCSMAFHTANNFHWLVFSTGTQLFLYDIDTEQWMPPWSFACQYISSGETSPGSYQLMASIGTKALQLNTTKFNDNGNTYQPIGKTNLFSLVPDFGRRFSYIAAGIYDEPSRTGYPVYVNIDTSKTTLADVLFIADDDPSQGTYVSIVGNLQTTTTAYNRPPGQFIQQNAYVVTQPGCRFFGIQWKLQNADQSDSVYGWFLAYKPVGGR